MEAIRVARQRGRDRHDRYAAAESPSATAERKHLVTMWSEVLVPCYRDHAEHDVLDALQDERQGMTVAFRHAKPLDDRV